MKILITILFLILSVASDAQVGDMIVIKQNVRTVQSFYKGALVQFITTDGNWINGRVAEIRDDSLFFNEEVIQQVPSPWGVARLDTFTLRKRGIHYTEIAGVPRKKEAFTFIKNGSLFMLGGAGYIGLNLFNSVYFKDPPFAKDNYPRLLIAAGVFGVGKLLNATRKPYLQVGKKYSIHYLGLKTDK